MIESVYWKEELNRIASTLRRIKNPPRWSERRHCTLERELMVGFFMLRRMIELTKVSNLITDRQLTLYSCQTRGVNVNKMNCCDLEQLYHMENEVTESKRPLYIANQFIHAYVSFPFRDETRNWSDIFIVSDFDRNDCIWRVPIETIRNLFLDASQDYPSSVSFVFDQKKNDYVIRATQTAG